MMETGIVFTGDEHETKSKFVWMMRRFLDEYKFLWFVHNYSFCLNPEGTMIAVDYDGERYFAHIYRNKMSEWQWVIDVTKKGGEQ